MACVQEKTGGAVMFSDLASQVITILVQAFMITLAGWLFVFTCWDIQDMRGGKED